MVKLVLVKHFGNDKAYAFGTTVDLDKGDIVEVDTQFGIQRAVCVTDSFEVSPSNAKNIARSLGGKKIKKVIGKYYFLPNSVLERLKKVDEAIGE